MPLIDLTFLFSMDNSELDAEVDDSVTASMLLQDLVNEGFIVPLDGKNRYYGLSVRGKTSLNEDQTLASAGVDNGDCIHVFVRQRGGRPIERWIADVNTGRDGVGFYCC